MMKLWMILLSSKDLDFKNICGASEIPSDLNI